MDAIGFAARPTAGGRETVWRVGADSLTWSDGAAQGRLALADIVHVRLFGTPGLRSLAAGGAVVAQGFAQCVITTVQGGRLVIASNHYRGVGDVEDRSAAFAPFVDVLLARTGAANARARFILGMPTGVWLLWLAALVVTALVLLFALTVVATGLSEGFAGNVEDVLVGVVVSLSAGLGVWRLFGILRRGRPRDFRPAPS